MPYYVLKQKTPHGKWLVQEQTWNLVNCVSLPCKAHQIAWGRPSEILLVSSKRVLRTRTLRTRYPFTSTPLFLFATLHRMNMATPVAIINFHERSTTPGWDARGRLAARCNAAESRTAQSWPESHSAWAQQWSWGWPVDEKELQTARQGWKWRWRDAVSISHKPLSYWPAHCCWWWYKVNVASLRDFPELEIEMERSWKFQCCCLWPDIKRYDGCDDKDDGGMSKETVMMMVVRFGMQERQVLFLLLLLLAAAMPRMRHAWSVHPSSGGVWKD